MEQPIWLYAFWAPIHENTAVQIMLVAVSVLIVADLVFGMIGAVVQQNFQSTKIREGLWHKCAEFVFILVADVIDAMLYGGVDLPFEIPNGSAMTVVLLALIVMEIASLMEVATRINPKLAENPLFKILDDAHIIHATRKDARTEETEED